MGIKDLQPDTNTRGMSIDSLLAELDPKLRDHLIEAMSARGLDGKHSLSPATIAAACADDGWIVTKHSIRMWRERNADS